MQMHRKIFGANRLVAAGFFIVFGAIAVSIFVPGVSDYIANRNFVGKMRMFNTWEPSQRLLLAYVLVGIAALMAVGYLRLLIDNTVVVLDRDGIEVRHPLWVHRGFWRDFDKIATTKLFGAKDIRIMFLPGEEGRGRRLSRKVRLPNAILGVDNKAVLLEAMVLVAAEQAMAPSTNTSTRGLRVAPGTPARRAVFGRRQ